IAACGVGELDLAFAHEILADRACQACVRQVMGAVREARLEAAHELVHAARAWLEALLLPQNALLDRGIETNVEVQERALLERAPIAAIKHFRPCEVERAAKRARPVASEHDLDAFAESRAHLFEERAAQVTPTPRELVDRVQVEAVGDVDDL